MTYLINYGYVDDVYAEDGEKQDVYLLGIDIPVKEFTGRVIAVYRRIDDVEDKWIVSYDVLAFQLIGMARSMLEMPSGKL